MLSSDLLMTLKLHFLIWFPFPFMQATVFIISAHQLGALHILATETIPKADVYAFKWIRVWTLVSNVMGQQGLNLLSRPPEFLPVLPVISRWKISLDSRIGAGQRHSRPTEKLSKNVRRSGVYFCMLEWMYINVHLPQCNLQLVERKS